MEYQELRILLRGTSGGRFHAQVVGSPCDETPGHELDLPLSEEELEAWSELVLEGVYRAEGRQAEYRKKKARSKTKLPKVTARGLGTALFEAVFAGDVGELYRRCLRELPSGRGLRIRLAFDPKEVTGSEALSELPWELLYDRRHQRFVARQRGVPVVRDLDWGTAETSGAVKIRPPLRILLVDAAPRGMRELALKTERERIEEALARLELEGQVELHTTDTLDGMRSRLLDEKIHVLHFMGHGGYLKDAGLGAIYFELPSEGAEPGEEDQVDGDELGESLSDLPDLGLVVLNACEGARYSGAPGRPAHQGVAAGILQRSGLPAVVAMQHVVSDAAAIAFAGRFYRRLAQGDPVDTAVSEARLGLGRRSAEWATPVLFLAARDGRAFEMDREGFRPTPRARLRPRRLGIRSMKAPPEEDQGRRIPHVTDRHLDLRKWFKGRYIREDRLWLDEVFPRLREFLDLETRGPRPVELMCAAHMTVGYAAGWLLQAKTGLDVAVLQPTEGEGIRKWSADDGTEPPPGEPLWSQEEPIATAWGGPDVAVALGPTRSIREQVLAYLDERKLPVGRLLEAELGGGTGQTKVAGGAHAKALAQSLAHRITDVPREPGSTLHLFAAAPLALVFFLGQLGRPFGRTVVYEYAFEASDSYARYRPSLVLPPPGEDREPPPGW